VKALATPRIWTHLNPRVKSQLSYAFSLARSAHYLAQNLTLPILERVVGQHRPPSAEMREQLIEIIGEVLKLLKKDAQNIADGVYPLKVLRPESPGPHFVRWLQIIYDGLALSKRRRDKNAHDFSVEAQKHFADVPAYFRRNFHFQTGGYLTKKSAELYEHQVQILFIGAADAMRRMIIPPMKEVYSGDGKGLRFLEIAAGTGVLSKFVKMAYPKAHITVTDISEPYLAKARQELGVRGFDFVRAAGEDLPFKDRSFDVVYSCFLFHELPLKIRKEVLHEAHRVLKPQGVFGFVDSLQKTDTKFLWALKQFPADFHEPFYKNYTEHDMTGLMKAAGLPVIFSEAQFFAKALLGQKK
jgi:ubiquinone/menaquinone biosynthesis C-methylase UbiE